MKTLPLACFALLVSCGGPVKESPKAKAGSSTSVAAARQEATAGEAIWSGCEWFDKRLSCPKAVVKSTLEDHSLDEYQTMVTEAGRHDLANIDGVPSGRAWVMRSISSNYYLLMVPTQDPSKTGTITCKSFVGDAESDRACRRMIADAHKTGKLPDAPKANDALMHPFGAPVPVVDSCWAISHHALKCPYGHMRWFGYDDPIQLKAQLGKQVAYDKQMKASEVYDFRCRVAGEETDCVLVQARARKAPVRTVYATAKDGDRHVLWSCMTWVGANRLEAEYENTCGRVIEILPAASGE